MSYNITFIDNCADLLCTAQGLNTNSDGWFGGLLIVSLWLLIVISMIARNRLFDDSLLASSAIVSLLAGALFGIGMIGGWVLAFPILILFVSIIIKVWR